MFLRVQRLSDIVTNDGLKIQDCYLEGTTINKYSNDSWPRQNRPQNKVWKLWKAHLIGTFYTGTHLTQPLGPWIHMPPQIKYIYIPITGTIEKQQSPCTVTTPATTNRRHISFEESWIPTTQRQIGIPLVEQGTVQTMPVLPRRLNWCELTWEQKRKQSWKRYAEALSKYDARSKYLTVDIQSSDVIWIVSDGGVDKNYGYHGWVIANDSRILCEGHGMTPGNPDQMDSLRAERGGMLHALTVEKRNKG